MTALKISFARSENRVFFSRRHCRCSESINRDVTPKEKDYCVSAYHLVPACRLCVELTSSLSTIDHANTDNIWMHPSAQSCACLTYGHLCVCTMDRGKGDGVWISPSAPLSHPFLYRGSCVCTTDCGKDDGVWDCPWIPVCLPFPHPASISFESTIFLYNYASRVAFLSAWENHPNPQYYSTGKANKDVHGIP